MTSQTRLLTVAVIGIAIVSACGGSDGDESAAPETTAAYDPTTTISVAGEVPSTEPPASEAAASTSEAPAITEPSEAGPDEDVANIDGACLIGEWVVTEEAMNDFYGGMAATLSSPVEFAVEGEAPLTLSADGTYRWEPAFDLVLEVAGASGTGATSGDIVGEWSASEGVLTTSADVNALEVTITVGGTTVGGSDIANGFLNGSPINGVTYSCAGPTPVLDFQTADPNITVPVTLTAA